MQSSSPQTLAKSISWAMLWRVVLGALLVGAPLALVRGQLLEEDPSFLVAAWLTASAAFPAGAFLVLSIGLGTTRRAGFLLAATTCCYVGILLLHHLYFVGRGGVPHLRQLSQLSELSSVAPTLFPLVGGLTLVLAIAPALGVGVLRYSSRQSSRHSPMGLAGNQARSPLLQGATVIWILALLLSNAAAAAFLEYRGGAPVHRLRVYEPNQVVAKLGLTSYWRHELSAFVRHRRYPLQNDFPGTVRELLSPEKLPTPDLPDHPAAPTQENLIWIQLESLDPLAIEELDSTPAMPFLHRLSQEGVYFPNFWAQHSGGGTSDAELSSLTSLLPLATHAGLQTLDYKNHLALPELLRKHGYRTLAFHGYRPSYYGRNQYLPNIGFDTFHAGRKLTGHATKLPLSDQPTLDAALSLILATAEPFFALIITVQGHGPHTGTASYLQEMRDVDRSLEAFITGLSNSGRLQHTTLFLYGDHLPSPDRWTSGKERVPFLLVSPHQDLFFDTTAPASHLDLAPTALALLGISRPSGWLGASLLGKPERQPVVLFNDLTALRTRFANPPQFTEQPEGMAALLYSASQLDP